MSLSLGVTHTSTYVGSFLKPIPVNVSSICGWGLDSPEPSFGQLDFSTLDRRILQMSAVPGNQTLALTLCCAPTWMLAGGKQGSTDWSRIEEFPDPSMVDAFAWLCAKIALRYPQVTHLLVWNEFKGLWSNGSWDVARYQTLYRAVHDAIKAVRPDVLIGGPYAPLSTPSRPSVLDANGLMALRRFWDTLDGRSCDFLVVDGWGDPTFWRELALLLHERWPCMPIWFSEAYVTDGRWTEMLQMLEPLNIDLTVCLWEPYGFQALGLR